MCTVENRAKTGEACEYEEISIAQQSSKWQDIKVYTSAQPHPEMESSAQPAHGEQTICK